MRASAVREPDFAVVGGGIVGAAIAYGLVSRGLRVVMFDGDDRDLRAARANYGIVWVQGKGMTMPAYQLLTRRSADFWPGFADELERLTGIGLSFERRGGLQFTLGVAEFEKRSADLAAMHRLPDAAENDVDMIERGRLDRMLPKVHLGNDVSGASHCWRDGHVNPLQLLRALQEAFVAQGGTFLAEHEIERLAPSQGGFDLSWSGGKLSVPKVVIAAGNGSATLAASVGLPVPLRPQRGQIFVTERLAPMLPLPAVPVRQTGEGTVLIGSSQEEVGLDRSTTVAVGARMAARAVRIIPRLAEAVIVRQWSGFRVMTPDSHPVYAESATFPGAFVALCHSGVTLAAAHAREIAGLFAEGRLGTALSPFHYRRFHVPQAA